MNVYIYDKINYKKITKILISINEKNREIIIDKNLIINLHNFLLRKSNNKKYNGISL